MSAITVYAALISLLVGVIMGRLIWRSHEKRLDRERLEAQERSSEFILKWNVASSNLARIKGIAESILSEPRPGEGGPYRHSVQDLIAAVEQMRDITLEKRGDKVADVGCFSSADEAFRWIEDHKLWLLTPMVRLVGMWDGPCYHVTFTHDHGNAEGVACDWCDRAREDPWSAMLSVNLADLVDGELDESMGVITIKGASVITLPRLPGEAPTLGETPFEREDRRLEEVEAEEERRFQEAEDERRGREL